MVPLLTFWTAGAARSRWLSHWEAVTRCRNSSVSFVYRSSGPSALLTLRFHPVVVDIAPGIGKISPEFRAYLDAMKEIDEAKVSSRKEADSILHKTEPVRPSFPSRPPLLPLYPTLFLFSPLNSVPVEQDLGVRQFLLTNLDRASPSSPYKFRLPLEYLNNAIEEIGHFPYAPGEKVYEKPTLFLKGSFPFLLFSALYLRD